MSETLLWDIIQGWLHSKHYNFKIIAVLDGYPIFEVEPNKFIISGSQCVMITYYRINISNYNGDMEAMTVHGPTKTLYPANPNFFEELEVYLNTKPEPPTNGTPTQIEELYSGDYSIKIINSCFDGTNKDHPAIEILDPNVKALVAGNTFKDYNVVIQSMLPSVDPKPLI